MAFTGRNYSTCASFDWIAFWSMAIELTNFSLPIYKAIQKGLTLTRLMDISGTEVRKRLRQKLYCEHLIPASVLQYIRENQIYINS